jgi:hypothetical protein
VAANNSYGITTVSLLDPLTGKTSKNYWNQAGASPSLPRVRNRERMP